MSSHKRRAFREDFPRRLAQLRLKIDSLPEQRQAFFHAAVDQAQRQHTLMQEQSAKICDMDADLGLLVEHTKFHVEACRRELRLLDPQGHFQL